MTRHFIRLYLLLVLALAGVVWGQEQLWTAFGPQEPASESSTAQLNLIEMQLRTLPRESWSAHLSSVATQAGLNVELLANEDIVGEETLSSLNGGGQAYMEGGNGTWLLKRLDGESVLALMTDSGSDRSLLEWGLALVFYASIALVIMIWLWPLTRDLKMLEKATASFGKRNWHFGAHISPRSQIYSLAQTFRKMAARIDSLISSHKDLSNAVAHEIKTPLSRMRFAIEMARNSNEPALLRDRLNDIETDIAGLNSLVHATLDYAVLERADFALNIGAHDLSDLLFALADRVRKDSNATARSLTIDCVVSSSQSQVHCDAHLLETAVKNLLYNAARYARRKVRIEFVIAATHYTLRIDDDGPGVPEADRERVFGSFVQLPQTEATKTGFGLGLAIVRRIAEWHSGTVHCYQSSLGGASFVIQWPTRLHAAGSAS